MARGFERDVRDAFARQPGDVRQEGNDIGRGQAGRNLIVGGRHAKRADRGGMIARYSPDLAGQLDRRGLAVGARHRDRDVGKGREIPGGEPGEALSRVGVGDMHCACNPRLGPRHHRDRATGDGGRNEILAIHPRALERAEDRSRRHLAMIDGEAGDGRFLGASGQRAELHSGSAESSPGAGHIRGNHSETSMARVGLGSTPSIAPVREMTRLTTGAAVQAAVVWPPDLGVSDRRIEHRNHHIARRVHRESRGERRYVRPFRISARSCNFGGAGLAADPVAGRFALAPGAAQHDQPQQLPHPRAGRLGEHAAPVPAARGP